MPAGREGEKEDKGGDERREEQGKEDGFTTALTVPTRTALSTRILIIKMPGVDGGPPVGGAVTARCAVIGSLG